jgi:DNA gyrase subunit A
VAFVDHRREVVTRRTLFELRQAEEKFHLLLGLLAAIDNIDRVIEIIRAAKDPEEAHVNLCAERFPQLGNLARLVEAADAQITQSLAQGWVQLTDKQAKAILELRLQRLTGLEREKLQAEAEELKALMAKLRKILSDDGELMRVIVGELTRIRDEFSNPRRTQITGEVGVYTDEDLIDRRGDGRHRLPHGLREAHVRPPSTARRSAAVSGVAGADTKEEDFVESSSWRRPTRTCWSSLEPRQGPLDQGPRAPAGRAHRPWQAAGQPAQLTPGERVSAIVPVREFAEDGSWSRRRKLGTVKKTPLSEYSRPRAAGIIGAGIDEGDEIIAAAS